MTQTGFDLQQHGTLGLNSSRMKLIRKIRIDLIHWNLRFVSNLSFAIWDLFVIWNLKIGIYMTWFWKRKY